MPPTTATTPSQPVQAEFFLEEGKGEDEPFEDEDRRDALIAGKTKALERKLKAMFPDLDSPADYAWAGTFGVTKTSLPMIGALPGMANT